MFLNGYSYRRKITIDHSQISGSDNLLSFPILLSGTYTYLKTVINGGKITNENGYDIRFESLLGEKLDHEIEYYSSSSGQVVIWIRIPILFYNHDTEFYMYYGKNGLTSSEENVAVVWDSSYKAVYHMNQAPNSSVLDSTSNNNDLTGVNTEAADLTTGKLGQGINFDGGNEYLRKTDGGGSDNLRLNGLSNMTMSGWIKASALTNNENFLWGKYDFSPGEGYTMTAKSDGKVGIKINGSSHDFTSAAGEVIVDTWYYIVGRFSNGTTAEIYKNGSSQIVNQSFSADPIDYADEPFVISNASDSLTTSFDFTGLIDEVRISDIARSNGWIVTEYNNQNSPSTFYSVGSEITSTSYSIEINGVDRTADVLNQSLFVDDVINEQVNTCQLRIIDLSGNGIPETDEEIIITLPDGTKLFGGYITKVNIDKGGGSVIAGLHCVDYTRLLDRNLVHKSYEDQTDKEIIEDIVSTYCPGFGITTTNVSEGATIDQISFNYLQPSQCIRRIAELTGRNWYIDYDKDIHYFPLTTNVSPFDIIEHNNQYSELEISKDSSQLKNRVYVRGGTKLSDSTTYEEKGDGIKTKFVLPDKPHNISVEVNGTPKSVGIKNVDLSGYDWYLNFQEKYLEQDEAGVVLTTSDTLTVDYQYDIPILVALENTSSIAENGVKEFAIFDKTIETTQAARDRASAELTDYANDLIEGSFITYIDGFKSGQYLNISLTEYDIDADYIVQRVHARSLGAGQFEYLVSIASAKTLGVIRFLIGLLEANKNLIELDDDEVVDELFLISDSLISDSLTENLTVDSTGPYHTWAVAGESTPITTMRWDLSQWG